MGSRSATFMVAFTREEIAALAELVGEPAANDSTHLITAYLKLIQTQARNVLTERRDFIKEPRPEPEAPFDLAAGFGW